MIYSRKSNAPSSQPVSQPRPIRPKHDRPDNEQPSRRLRIVLYSHDTMGLGHKRRNLLIAQTLGASTLDADILLISGMRDASDTPTPKGVDTLTLPALHKCADGHYQSRHLALGLDEIISLRSKIILEAIKSFGPDVIIIDNVPRGAVQELNPTLEYLYVAKKLRCRNDKPYTHCILGLRDVLDTPEVIKRSWEKARNIEAIRRYYDAVWVYGDAQLYDIRTEIDFPDDIIQKMQPLGYLDQRARLSFITPRQDSLEPLHLSDKDNVILCLVGGGQDGAALAQAFAQAHFPKSTIGILVAGPFMPKDIQAQLHAQVECNPQCQIMDYVEEPTTLLARADRVIAMGGYNTVCEILSFQKPALVVPRVTPRLEQWIRAERLQKRGILDVLHPNDICSDALTHWLNKPVTQKTVINEHKAASLNLHGLDNLLDALSIIIDKPVLAHRSPATRSVPKVSCVA